MRKRMLALFLSIIMVLCLMPISVSADPVATPTEITADYTWYGDGSAATFTIDSVEDLVGLANITNGKDGQTKSDFADKTVSLAADLSFAADQYWYYNDGTTVIDYRIDTFAGSFDGLKAPAVGDTPAETYTISGLKFYNGKIDLNANMYLFSSIRVGGSVSNLTLDTVTAKINGYDYFGFLAYNLYGTATDCHVKNIAANVAVSTNGKGYISNSGAMFGSVTSATITGCTAQNVTITCAGADTTDKVGALIGISGGSDTARTTIDNCSVTNVTFNLAQKTKRLGGFVGQTSYTNFTDCTAATVQIYIGNYYQHAGGFVGSASTASTFTRCTVSNFTLDADTGDTNYPGYANYNTVSGDVGGFAAETSGSSVAFIDCTVTDLNLDMECDDSNGWGMGGLIGYQGGSITISGCSVSGDITMTTDVDGGLRSFSGSFVGYTASNTSTAISNSAADMDITATGSAGGYLGIGKGNHTITNCTVTGSVTSSGAVAGGFAGYLDTNATMTVGEGSTSAATVSGVLTEEVAGSANKVYTNQNGEIIVTDATGNVCYGYLGANIGFTSIQAALDLGVDKVTLLQDVEENVILEREGTTDFTLDMGDYLLKSIVTVHHKIHTVKFIGTNPGSEIQLTEPYDAHDVFRYWCSGDLLTNTSEEAVKSGDNWIAVPGKTYHTHFTQSGYEHIDQSHRDFNFPAATYGYNVSDITAQEVTFTYDPAFLQAGETPQIVEFVDSLYFDGTGIGTLTASFKPKAGLAVGEYEEKLYVVMHDGSSHEIFATFVVQDAVYTPPPAAPTPITYRNDNFATATGLFNDIAYYKRAARPGDILTLKVALSEIGSGFGLDFTKIEVKYEVEGAVQISDNYLYTGDPLYVDGIATDFMLSAGTNIIVAHIYYNGFEAGTCAPFYAYVGE